MVSCYITSLVFLSQVNSYFEVSINFESNFVHTTMTLHISWHSSFKRKLFVEVSQYKWVKISVMTYILQTTTKDCEIKKISVTHHLWYYSIRNWFWANKIRQKNLWDYQSVSFNPEMLIKYIEYKMFSNLNKFHWWFGWAGPKQLSGKNLEKARKKNPPETLLTTLST